MSRRRYISTDISTDSKVNMLARKGGDFAVLLYTWMIPHADDRGFLNGNSEELILIVMPGRRDKSIADFEAALQSIHDHQLITWDRENNEIRFPAEAFYRYQTYIKPSNRRAFTPTPDEGERRNPPSAQPPAKSAEIVEKNGSQRKTAISAQNAAKRRTSAEKAASPSPSLSPSLSPPEEGKVPSEPTPRQAVIVGDVNELTDERPFDLVAAMCEELGTDAAQQSPRWLGAQLATAKRAQEQGWNVDQVRRFVQWAQSRSWSTDTISMFTVESKGGDWKANGEPVTAERSTQRGTKGNFRVIPSTRPSADDALPLTDAEARAAIFGQ